MFSGFPPVLWGGGGGGGGDSGAQAVLSVHALVNRRQPGNEANEQTVNTQTPYNIMRSKRQFKLTVFAIMMYTSFFAASQRRLSPIIVTTTICYWELMRYELVTTAHKIVQTTCNKAPY